MKAINIFKIKSFLIIIIILSGFMVLLNPVSASEIHVYPGDNIVTKIASAVSGDIVYIHAGTYFVDHSASGTININANNIKIIGDGANNTFITIKARNNGFSASSRSNIIIKNLNILCDFTRDANIYVIYLGNNSTVSNCIIKSNNSGHTGILGGDNCIVEHTIVSNLRWDGIRLGNNASIFNCLAYNNGDNGIQVGSNSNVSSCTSVNNGLRPDAQDRGGIVARIGTNNYLENNLTVKDCIVANNPSNSYGGGIGGIIAGSGLVSYSNIYNSNGTPTGLTIGPGVIYQDPNFIDGINSFYLSPLSPCVDKGSDTSVNIGLYKGYTTRTDQYWDINTLDMGYHYTSGKGPLVENKTNPMEHFLRILKLNKYCKDNPDAEGCKSSK